MEFQDRPGGFCVGLLAARSRSAQARRIVRDLIFRGKRRNPKSGANARPASHGNRGHQVLQITPHFLTLLMVPAVTSTVREVTMLAWLMMGTTKV